MRQLILEVEDLKARLVASEAGAALRPLVDPIERWRREHWQELLQYAGSRVAIHPTKGIVASGKDLASVLSAVRQQGLASEVVVESVRPIS